MVLLKEMERLLGHPRLFCDLRGDFTVYGEAGCALLIREAIEAMDKEIFE